MRQNKAFQFCVGAFVLFLAFRLYQEQWFASLFEQRSNEEGVESLDLVAMFITAAVSAVQMVGLIAIGIVAGLQPLVTSLMDGVIGMLSPSQSKPDDTVQELLKRIADLEAANEKTDA